MTQGEKEYFDQLKEMDLDKELRYYLRIKTMETKKGIKVNIDQMIDSFKDIISSLKTDISETRKNIFMNIVSIRNIIDNTENLINMSEKEEDNTEKSKYDSVISTSLSTIDNIFKENQELYSTLAMYEDSLDRANEYYDTLIKTKNNATDKNE